MPERYRAFHGRAVPQALLRGVEQDPVGIRILTSVDMAALAGV